jgi:adenylosuccinate synthase
MTTNHEVNNPRFVVLSGPVGAGKSTLARGLELRYNARHIRTQHLMRDYAEAAGESLPAERKALQEYGERLDRESDGKWVAYRVAEIVATDDDDRTIFVVDSVRLKSQVDHLRSAFPTRVTHIHVHAPHQVLGERYSERESGLRELSSYEEVTANATEAAVTKLADDADVSIDSDRCLELDVQTRAAAALRLLPSRSARLVDVIVGGGYGSEGKGNIAFYLAPEYQVLMRVGGPNAGHKVPTTPTPYTHRLLPSGTQANQTAKILIGPGATLDLEVLLREIADCDVDAGRLLIDPQAMIIEEADKTAEQAAVASIGSTGKGGGAAAARRINGRNNTVQPPVRLARDVPELAPYVGQPISEALESAYAAGERILLEGTQGTELSIFHGNYPYVTSRDTTTAGTLAEAGIGPHRVNRVIMVTRTYPIRVANPPDGTSGPMGQEIDWKDIAERSGYDEEKLRGTERGSVSGNRRRVAEFSWHQMRRAAELNGTTDIALTFTDYIDKNNADARRYDQLSSETIQFIEDIERVAGAPVTLIATRFDRRSVIDRREW